MTAEIPVGVNPWPTVRETRDELSAIVAAATRLAALGGIEESCPYELHTAQEIIWTQAFRLTLDRISDLAA